MYIVHKSIEEEYFGIMNDDPHAFLSLGFCLQCKQLFHQRCPHNALISAGTVNFVQQMCRVNTIAFYSGEIIFSNAGANKAKSWLRCPECPLCATRGQEYRHSG